MNKLLTIKCRKCRSILYENEFAVNAHGTEINKLNTNSDEETCPTVSDRFCFTEEILPDWMLSFIESSNWTKGKLTCTKCEARIGSFDFVSGNKCECTLFVIPPVYLIKSKTDIFWS